MGKFYHPFLLLFFIFLSKNVMCQIHYTSKAHKITCENNSLIEHVKFRGIITDTDGAEISIRYTGLEKIEEINLEYIDKRNRKVKKKDFIKTSLMSSSFYDGMEALQYYIDKPTAFTLSYKVVRNDLMYISTLRFFNYYKCDTMIYELTVPFDKSFTYNFPVEIENLRVDSLHKVENMVYTFSQYENSNTPMVDFKMSNSNYIIPNYSSNVVRIHISDSDSPKKSLNDWYNGLIKSTGELNENSKREIDSLLNGIINKDLIIKELHKFIQTKIRYLDIEDGINAFVPRNVNDILTKRQGDCKDMSNLMVKALTYKGVDAYMALSSSLSHRFNLDFPNIASANHVVCVTQKDGKWIVVDATDKYSQYPFPSSHTQGRNVFIINDDGGLFSQVKKIPYNNNLDSIYADFSIKNDRIKGKIEMVKNGYSNRKFIASKEYYNKEILSSKIKKILLKDYELYDINNLEYNTTIENSIIKFDLSQRNPSITKVNNKVYLPVKSLIHELHPFPNKVKLGERLITYGAVYKKIMIKLNLDSEFTLLKNLNNSYQDESLKFLFKTEQTSTKSLLIECEMIIDEVELKGDQLNRYRLFNKAIQDIINQSIIYVEK
jgi:hypothetical protein